MTLRNRVPAFPPTTIYAIVRPSSDVSDGLWTTQAGGTALSTVLDETVRDDSDYARSDATTFNDVFEVHLDDPASTFQNGTLKIVIGKETNNADVVDFFVELRQGTTTIASWAYADVAYGAVMKTERLSDAQFAAITDFTDLRVRVTAGRFWTPLELGADRIAWFDASVGPFTYATGISQWNDLSGLGNHVTQSTGSSQPLLNSSYLNGKPSVVFDGGDRMARSFTTTIDWTTVAVFQPSAVGGTRCIVDTDDVGGMRHAQDLRLNGTSVESIAFNTGGTPFTDTGSVAMAAGTPAMAISVRGPSAVEVFLNGSTNGFNCGHGNGPERYWHIVARLSRQRNAIIRWQYK